MSKSRVDTPSTECVQPICFLELQYSTVTVQYSTVQLRYSTITVQYSYSTVQYSTVTVTVHSWCTALQS